MYTVMYYSEDSLQCVKGNGFSTFEEAQERAKKIAPQYRPFVSKSMDESKDLGLFAPIEKEEPEQDLLLMFPSFNGYEAPIERGTYSRNTKDGEQFTLTSGVQMNASPIFKARIPTEGEMFEIGEDKRELPLGKYLLLCFPDGMITNGYFEKSEDDGEIIYWLWSDDEVCDFPTHYAHIPSF